MRSVVGVPAALLAPLLAVLPARALAAPSLPELVRRPWFVGVLAAAGAVLVLLAVRARGRA